MSKIPVLVLAFNRPDHVIKALEAIREYCPDRVYLACDGPREEIAGEVDLVLNTQKSMLHAIDWNCSVKTLFREKNLGCAHAVYDAISWFFSYEEYGIISEDDMILGLDFFRLCEDLLPRYAKESRIMCISAQNHSKRTDITNTYVYSYRSSCWGWASWARAWKKMDMTMSAAPKLSYMFFIRKLGVFEGIMTKRYFSYGYSHLPTFNSWAYRWCLSVHANNGLVIVPGVNLAINIGVDGGEHFEKGDVNPYADLTISPLRWPLQYNDSLLIEKRQAKYDADDFLNQRMIGLRKKIRKFLKR